MKKEETLTKETAVSLGIEYSRIKDPFSRANLFSMLICRILKQNGYAEIADLWTQSNPQFTFDPLMDYVDVKILERMYSLNRYQIDEILKDNTWIKWRRKSNTPQGWKRIKLADFKKYFEPEKPDYSKYKNQSSEEGDK